MDFQRYPFDFQHCLIGFESWSYTSKVLKLKLLSNVAYDLEQTKKSLSLNQFYFDVEAVPSYTMEYSTGEISFIFIIITLLAKSKYLQETFQDVDSFLFWREKSAIICWKPIYLQYYW